MKCSDAPKIKKFTQVITNWDHKAIQSLLVDRERDQVSIQKGWGFWINQPEWNRRHIAFRVSQRQQTTPQDSIAKLMPCAKLFDKMACRDEKPLFGDRHNDRAGDLSVCHASVCRATRLSDLNLHLNSNNMPKDLFGMCGFWISNRWLRFVHSVSPSLRLTAAPNG